jgi:hypothetical protein
MTVREFVDIVRELVPGTVLGRLVRSRRRDEGRRSDDIFVRSRHE